MFDRLPGPMRRWLYAGGTRQDRLRDPDAVVADLGLRPGMIVADLGPGYGHFTFLMARAVEPDGRLYALDASRDTLDELRQAADDRGKAALRVVEVPPDRLEVPEPVDLLFVSATYHHLPDPARYFAAARAFLRPGGRLDDCVTALIGRVRLANRPRAREADEGLHPARLGWPGDPASP